MRRVLLLIPVLLVAAAVGVWAWQTFGPRPDTGPAPPEVHVKTETAAGVTFEVEHERREGAHLATSKGDDWIEFLRGGEVFNYIDGVMTLNGLGFPGLKAGDVVRWNLDGTLLVNGAPQSPHPIQPRPLEAPATDLRWDHRGGSPYPRDTLSVGWPRAGRTLVAAHGDGVVRVWDADRGTVTQALFHEPPKEGGKGAWGVRASISPGGKTVATANMYAPDVTLWDAATGNKLAALATPPGNVRDVRFLSDEWLLEVRGESLLARHLAGDRSKVVELGKVAADPFESPFALSGDAKTLAANDGTKATVSRVTIAPAGPTLAPTGAVVEKLSADAVLALSHDGSLLAVFTGGERVNRLLTVYDAATGAVRHHLRWRADPEGPNPATALCFLPDGQTLAVGEPKSVRLYDLASGRERGWVPVGWPRALAASPDGKTLAAATRYESGLRLWEIAALK